MIPTRMTTTEHLRILIGVIFTECFSFPVEILGNNDAMPSNESARGTPTDFAGEGIEFGLKFDDGIDPFVILFN